ncbi:MAG: hypothetical protein M3P93_05515 [Actinomycetota bacterium]|nr:hypothetical protein [Actinomycetota bacterium]
MPEGPRGRAGARPGAVSALVPGVPVLVLGVPAGGARPAPAGQVRQLPRMPDDSPPDRVRTGDRFLVIAEDVIYVSWRCCSPPAHWWSSCAP